MRKITILCVILAALSLLLVACPTETNGTVVQPSDKKVEIMTEGGKRQIAFADDSSIKVTLKYDGLKDGEQIKYNINNKVKKDSILYSAPFPVKAKSLINVALFNKDGNIIPGTENSLQIYKITKEFITKKELAECINKRIADSSIGLEGDYNDIGLGEIKDLSKFFSQKGSIDRVKEFNGDISAWDTSKVTNMKSMFNGASAFNKPLNFDTSSVTNMESMFEDAVTFNQPLKFNTQKVTNMKKMFCSAKKFNQLLNFNTENVEDMYGMFNGAISFNQPLKFNTEKVTNMAKMFLNAPLFDSALGEDFNTSKVTKMDGMFHDATNFNQSLGDNFDTSNVKNMDEMFYGAENFNQSLGKKFNTAKVTTMEGMFCGAKNFNQPLGDEFKTSEVTNMKDMFHAAESFNQSLSGFNVEKVTNMTCMFIGTKAFDQDLSKWKPKSVTNMDQMFEKSVYSHSLVDWEEHLIDNVSHVDFRKEAKNLTDDKLPAKLK